MHPGFTAASSIVLHKFSTNAQPYEVFRNELLGVETRETEASPLIVAAAPPRKGSGIPANQLKFKTFSSSGASETRRPYLDWDESGGFRKPS